MDRAELKLLDNHLSCIYKIISPTERVYVGQSVNVKARYRNHLSSIKTCDTKLTRSFKKYGYKKHKFEIVEICDKEKLSDREKYYIRKYNCIDEGLNTIDRNYTQLEEYDHSTYWSEKRKKEHSKFMKELWKDNPGYFRRDDDFKQKVREGNIDKVTARTKDGDYIKVSKREFDNRDDLVGTTGGVTQPKLKKGVVCTTDNKEFNSIKEAARYYDFSEGNICSYIKKEKPLGKRKYGRELYFEYI